MDHVIISADDYHARYGQIPVGDHQDIATRVVLTPEQHARFTAIPTCPPTPPLPMGDDEREADAVAVALRSV